MSAERDSRPEEGGRQPPITGPSFPGLEILSEIAPGVGGMGKVYLARETSLQRLVAVKTVQERFDSSRGREWFVREARSAAALDHPGIVRIYSFHPNHEPPYYVMQLVEGGRPLDEAFGGAEPLVTARAFERIARALHYAHDQGVLHRDIKPANVLVDSAGEPHIADFGLAKIGESASGTRSLTTSSVKGTPAYIAPEVYADPAASSPASDVFALGVTLYRVLCGVSPFPGNTVQEVCASVIQGQPRLPQQHLPDLPEPLQRICLKALERQVADRYESAKAMAADLERFVAGREVLARPRRYQVELEGRLHTHLADIRAWKDQRLIGLEQMDRLRRPYRRLLDDDAPRDERTHRVPWDTVTLRFGAWLVLIASILWPVFYWHHLDSLQRVAAVGLPTVLFNLAGWSSHRRGSRLNAIAFLASGALLVPILTAVLLSEYGLLRWTQSAPRELFGMDVVTATHVDEGREAIPDEHWVASHRPGIAARVFRQLHGIRYRSVEDLPPEQVPVFESVVDRQVEVDWSEEVEAAREGRGTFLASNFQLLLAASAFLAFSGFLLRRVRARVFVPFVAVGVYLVHFWILTRCGLIEWWDQDRQSLGVLLFLPIPLIFIPWGRALRRRGRGSWGAWFHAFFPIPFAALLTVLAFTGAREWLEGGGRLKFRGESLQLWLMVNGLVHYAAATMSTRSSIGFVRFWGPWFLALVPLSFLVPCNVLFNQSPDLFQLGAESFTIYELGSAVFSVVFVTLGTRLSQVPLSLAGLAGTVTFLVRATDRHFGDVLAWPLTITLLGTAAMVAGVVAGTLRARRRDLASRGRES